MTSGRRRAARHLAAMLAVPLAACTSTPIDPYAPRVVSGVRIAPYEQHEDCIDLKEDDRLDFRFDAQAPVDFALRYREGAVVIMPLSRNAVHEFGSVFVARATQAYCLAWEAGPQGAIVDYRLRVRPPDE
jgi:hypothetical protein